MNTEPDNSNPFAPSQVVSEPDALPIEDDLLIWREGRQVLTSLEAELPQRCVYCNGEVTRSRRAYQFPLTLRGLKKIKLAYWVCGRHSLFGWLRDLALVPLIGYVVGGLILSAYGFDLPVNIDDTLSIAAIVLSAIVFTVALLQAPSLQLNYRRGNFQSITGCGKPFLNSLPTKSKIDTRR